MPRSSQPDRPPLLIAAVSGRALAAAAYRAGFAPLVADFFADADTQAIAQSCRKFAGKIRDGIGGAELDEALAALGSDAPSSVLGCVYGSGFEDRPELLARIAEDWTVIGNDAATVERVKAPESFFGTLDRLGIEHPRTGRTLPSDGGPWLKKRQGGAGGSHIVTARSGEAIEDDRYYYQERVSGRAVSALFVADGGGARVLGFSEQWAARSSTSNWRYGGAVRPAELGAGLEQEMKSAVETVAPACKLRGLCSADFLVDETRAGRGKALLLEINPRPGATLDIFDSDAAPLLRLHVDAVMEKRLPEAGLDLSGAAASAIVYAAEATRIPETMDWPDFAADIPHPGERIDKNRPICTVLARAETKARAKRLVEVRIAMILAACGPKKA